MFNWFSHGGGMNAEAVQRLPGSPLVVEYAPQLELLAKARLTTQVSTLCSIRSAMGYLWLRSQSHMNNQESDESRWTGTEVVPLTRLSIPRLRAAIQQVLREDSYSHHALRLKQSIRQSGGVRAADIVEQAVRSSSPVAVGLGASTSW